MVMMITMIKQSKGERDAQRTTTLGETSSASTVTKLIYPIPHFTLIWSKSIPRVLMENWETRQQVVEEEADQEKIHTKDKILGLKTSLRPLREMVVQSTLFAALRKCTASFSRCHILIPPSLRPLLVLSNKVCMTIQSTSTSFSFHRWLMTMVTLSSRPSFQVKQSLHHLFLTTSLWRIQPKIWFLQCLMTRKKVMILKSPLPPTILKEVKLKTRTVFMKEAILMRTIMVKLMEMLQMETMELNQVLRWASHIMDR